MNVMPDIHSMYAMHVVCLYACCVCVCVMRVVHVVRVMFGVYV